jgi:hypothetical protein
MLPTFGQSSTSSLEADSSLTTLDEDSAIDECKSHTTGCSKGGLHMADHKQMIAFAKRVSRLRFHSQCASGTTDLNATITGSGASPGTSPSSTSSSSLQNFKARIIKRSFSLPNIQKPVISEDDESVLDEIGMFHTSFSCLKKSSKFGYCSCLIFIAAAAINFRSG